MKILKAAGPWDYSTLRKKSDQKLIFYLKLLIRLEWLYHFLIVRKIDDGHEVTSENKFRVFEEIK